MQVSQKITTSYPNDFEVNYLVKNTFHHIEKKDENDIMT